MKEGEASQSVRKFSVKAEDVQIDDQLVRKKDQIIMKRDNSDIESSRLNT